MQRNISTFQTCPPPPPGQPPNMSTHRITRPKFTQCTQQPIYHQRRFNIMLSGLAWPGLSPKVEPGLLEERRVVIWFLSCLPLTLLLLLMSCCCCCCSAKLMRITKRVSIKRCCTPPPFSSSTPTHHSPEMCEKHCVNVATVNPLAKAVARSTEETLAPTPEPAAAPHTMNTYRNEAKHSEIMDLWTDGGDTRDTCGN